VFGLESISLYGFGPFTAPAVFFFYMAGNFFIYLTIVYLCDSGALGRAWRRVHGRASLDPLPLPAYSVRLSRRPDHSRARRACARARARARRERAHAFAFNARNRASSRLRAVRPPRTYATRPHADLTL
jgi:hypothetical protein